MAPPRLARGDGLTSLGSAVGIAGLAPVFVPNGRERPVNDTVLIEAFHLAVFVPRDLPRNATADLRRALDRPTLRAALRRAVRATLHRHPALRPAVVTLSR